MLGNCSIVPGELTAADVLLATLAQVAQQDREYLRKYLWAPPPPQLPSSQSQLLAALALRNCLPVRCR